MGLNLANTPVSGEQKQIMPDRSNSLIFVVDDAPLIGEVVEAFLKI